MDTGDQSRNRQQREHHADAGAKDQSPTQRVDEESRITGVTDHAVGTLRDPHMPWLDRHQRAELTAESDCIGLTCTRRSTPRAAMSWNHCKDDPCRHRRSWRISRAAGFGTPETSCKRTSPRDRYEIILTATAARQRLGFKPPKPRMEWSMVTVHGPTSPIVDPFSTDVVAHDGRRVYERLTAKNKRANSIAWIDDT
jgi:hypothetical protein